MSKFFWKWSCHRKNLNQEKIYKKSIENQFIDDKDFATFGEWTRSKLALREKNRNGAYSFSNKDWRDWRKIWVSKDPSHLVPKDHDSDNPPNDDPVKEPHCYGITVLNNQTPLKGDKACEVILVLKTYQACVQYEELKKLQFKRKNPRHRSTFSCEQWRW